LNIELLLSILGLAVSVIGILWLFFKEIGDLRKENAANKEELIKLIKDQGNQIGEIRVKTNLFWRLVEENVSSILKQPIHLEKDMLLDKLRDGKIHHQEVRRLCDILKDELSRLPEKSPERIGYTLVLTSIMVRYFPEECEHDIPEPGIPVDDNPGSIRGL
jgi:hypothetical protein